MTDRSARMEVRNPILGLPSMAAMEALPPEAREALRGVLLDISRDAAGRAEKSWRQNKGPMAAYWKAVSVYAKHIRNALRLAAAAAPAESCRQCGEPAAEFREGVCVSCADRNQDALDTHNCQSDFWSGLSDRQRGTLIRDAARLAA